MMRRAWGLLLLLLLLSPAFALAPSSRRAYLRAREVSPSYVRYVIERLSSMGSRFTGYPGCERAARFIASEFERMGLKVMVQRYPVVVPLPTGKVELRIKGRAFPVEPLWPNFVNPPRVRREALKTKVIYARDGSLRWFNRLPVRDSIVVLDFDSDWLNAALLGASAVVFLEPERMERASATRKFLRVPVDVPRFLLPRRYVNEVLSLLGPKRQAEGGLRLEREGPPYGPALLWKRIFAPNVIAFLPGTLAERRNEYIVVEAYFDSTSISPLRSPGAEQAASVAALLSLAKALKAFPPPRSVLFVATSGHFQGLAGARHFFSLIARRDPRLKELDDRRKQIRDRLRRIAKLEKELSRELSRPKPLEVRIKSLRRRIEEKRGELELAKVFYRNTFPLSISLDLSARGSALASFQAGWFFHDAHLMRFFSPLGKYLTEVYQSVPKRGLFPFVDAINPTQERDWETYLPVRLAFDSETAVRLGLRAITLATAGDERPLFDTTSDTLGRLRIEPIVEQARTAAVLVGALCDEMALEEKPLKRLKRLPYRLKPVEGMVYEFEREKTFLPSTPVPNCVVVVAGLYKSLGGVKPEAMDISDEAGEFEIFGVQGFQARDFYVNSVLEAYKIDPITGEIVYAPDLGIDGEKRYPRDVAGRMGLKRPLMVFRCRAIDVFDLVDPRYLETLEQAFVFDAKTDAEPLSWGLSRPVAVPMGTQGGAPAAEPSYVEPCAVVYAMPGQPVKIGFSMGLLGLRMILLNSSPRKPEGVGFVAGKVRSIPLTSYQAAKDMWILDDSRLRLQARHGIVNQRVRELHSAAKQELVRARKALRRGDYEQAVIASRRAWAFESRAYPDVQGTSVDVVKGILFYLAMLLPFAFFAERLLFAFPDIFRQVAATLLIFLAVFGILRFLHPAFELGIPSFIILLGFIVLALAIIVITIVTMKFNEQLKRIQREMMGVHEQDVSRLSAVTTAFSLGLANMRRRKARTALTAVTIILLTFTVLSFTSVRALLRYNVIPLRKKPVYKGILVRDRTWEALEEPALRELAEQLKGRGVVAGRAWLVSADPQKRLVIDVERGEKTYAVHALMGLPPSEPEVTGVGRSLTAGRWFREGERDVCLLSEETAEALGVRPGDEVKIRGRIFKVVGVYDSEAFAKAVDLDGEPLTPIDYAALRPEQLKALKELAAAKFKLGQVSAAGILEEYTHYSPSDVVIIPSDALLALGGTLRSVACKLRKGDPLKVAEEFVRRLALPIYASAKDKVVLYSSLGLTTMSGLSDVLIPMVIAGLIVLNTMLGAVYERVREIGTFSAVGLAPAHIASFFLAEAAVFAVIGAVVGYLLGQGIGKLVVTYNLLPGVYLNYSSVATVASSFIVMAVVLLSTLYPARKASQMAVPGIERRWRLPEPVGDEMRMRLPFMLTGGDALACNAFLKEFFDAYVDFTGGEFYTDKVLLNRVETDKGPGLSLRLRVWLAPYDLGVSQDFELLTKPTGEGEIYELDLTLKRVSGDLASWRKTNWLFINLLRKQFLIWRTIPPAEKRRYEAEARKVLEAERAVS